MTDMSNIRVTPIAEQHSIEKGALENLKPDSALSRYASENADALSFLSSSSSRYRDPLELIDQLLTKYLGDQTLKAEKLAEKIKEMTDAIAEIQRIWAIIMNKNLAYTTPGDIDDVADNFWDTDNVGGPGTGNLLAELNRIITQVLHDPRGINVITEGSTSGNGKNPTYDMLQAMNASMSAYCDTIQVDVDTKNQKFKNIMTEISSVQEEIRNLRQSIISITKK